ncbi:MAG: hydroxymethylglutaryl-CoA lyase [Candidatus Eremiobacteraeota bacterium]|nr:hydroxymethylglutaryl-CoA lyase [Candidatus Eremiobacteraeota bacterium]
MTLPHRVQICEMGPRDGLQNEVAIVASADKVRYIDMLSQAGLPLIEATSFVSSKAIPQLSDAAQVYSTIEKRAGVRYLVLVPNLKGLERARIAGVDSIAVFTAASETFTKKNINMTIAGSLALFEEVVHAASSLGMWVRGYVSTCFGCPYEGPVAVSKVLEVSRALDKIGVDEISLGDTIGVGVPTQVFETVAALREHMPVEKLALHLHDTRGTALANVLAGLQSGVSIFDSSAGGLGGCPYAPGASGNLGTEDLLYMLHGMGIETGVDISKVRDASRFIAGVLQHDLSSKVYSVMEKQPA